MKRFEVIDHPSDVGIVAYGGDQKELFENAAFGMFSLMCDVSKVRPVIERRFEISGDDRESLLVNWLNELIFVVDAKKMVFSRFIVEVLDGKRLAARAAGEPIDQARHDVRMALKAATFNQLGITCETGSCTAKVVFDV